MNDSLLFYAFTGAGPGIQKTMVFDRLHQLMVNGINIIGLGWYHELLIIPKPDAPHLFYLFTAGVTTNYGIYYSIIDLSLNGGLGEIVQKNVPLQTFPVADGITAIKHGNGRDWWVVFRPYDPNLQNWSNTFYKYLITPIGIGNFPTQNIGSAFLSNTSRMKFNKHGSRLCTVDAGGIIDIFDFDRCSGIFTNPMNIAPVSSAPFPYYWDAEFSPSGQYLYVSANPDTSFIFQYDLYASNIAASKDTIWSTTFPEYTGGHLKIAPDSNIYYGTTYYNGFQFPYPYADTMYNMYNMNLGVIHDPDSGGNACNFQPWSFTLNGYRSYGGLPNNPDYEMGALTGSPCDSLTSLQEMPLEIAVMNTYYNTDWELLFLNCSKLKGRRFQLIIYDITGKVIFREVGRTNTNYFTRDVSLAGKTSGVYIVRFETDRELLTGKFILN